MKSRNLILLACTLFVAASVTDALSQVDTLAVIHINDTHSHLVPYGPKDKNADCFGTRGGIARAATYIGGIQATEENVLFLHGGDLFVGDFMFNKYFGVPELQILAQLGCDAMVLGNHEFDLTPALLEMALTEAGFPMPGFDILSANLDMSEYPDLIPLVQPYTIREVGDLTVGIFGLTTEAANDFSMPDPVVVTDCGEGAAAAVAALAPQCDLIIALTHLGLVYDTILAQSVPGIDLIVGGHSHDVTTTPVGVTNPTGGTTWIVQAGEFYDYVGNLKLACSPSGVEILSYELLAVDDNVPEVPEVADVVDVLVQGVEADPRYGPVYTEIIAEAAADIERDFIEGDRRKDTPMGNLVTDAYRDETETDIALASWGFISQKLYDGPLCGADIFQTVPYGYDEESGLGFKLMTFELTGADIWTGLEATTELAPLMHDLYMQVSGMSFQYDPSKPPGQKIDWILIGDEPIDSFAVYTVTANSGVTAAMVEIAQVGPQNLQDTGLTEYHVVRDYIVENSPIEYQVEGRILEVLRPSDIVAGSGPEVTSPQELVLCWNAPNPFESATSISYSLPADGRVRLEIFNHAGQRVTTLADEWQVAGEKTVQWDARSFPSGVYFRRLTVGDFAHTGAMVLHK
jgi:2',3'-cyclic-nucleotide 2'-phosphodiesterase (5'-nucleotidase family)